MIEIDGVVYRTEAQWERRHRHVRSQSRHKGVERTWRTPSGSASAVFWREEQTRPWSKRELAQVARERREARERKKLDDAYERGYADAESELLPMLAAKRAIARHRERALRGLLPAKTRDRIVIDTETTGLDWSSDELLQVAITDGAGVELLNEFYRPRHVERWPEAQAINGISPDDVSECPHADSDRERIQEIVDSARQVVIYNAEFDTDFLEEIGIDFAAADVHCAMLDFAQLYGEYDEYHGDYRWQKLMKAAAYTKYEGAGRAHDALEDCKMAAHVQRWCDEQRGLESS